MSTVLTRSPNTVLLYLHKNLQIKNWIRDGEVCHFIVSKSTLSGIFLQNSTILFGTMCQMETQGALECNMTGKCPFFKNFHNLFKKKIISIPCFGIKFPENNSENNSLLFLKN